MLDIDAEELKKLGPNYESVRFDLAHIEELLPANVAYVDSQPWLSALDQAQREIDDGMSAATSKGDLNPYKAVQIVQKMLEDDAIVVSDCGANLCWVYQSFLPSRQLLFTAAGNSPMGYSLPAAIGASISEPNRQVACFIGDGGLQMNLQELQTVANLNLPIKIFIQNNFGYGIIKQFQDSYFDGRHHASGQGYSLPSFSAIAQAFGIQYVRANTERDLEAVDLVASNPQIIDIALPPGALITPKVEMDRFLHDQFPYVGNPGVSKLPYAYPSRPSEL